MKRNIYFYVKNIFPENFYKKYFALKGIGIGIVLGKCICICKFCKEYLPMQNPKKKILFAPENYHLLSYLLY